MHGKIMMAADFEGQNSESRPTTSVPDAVVFVETSSIESEAIYWLVGTTTPRDIPLQRMRSSLLKRFDST